VSLPDTLLVVQGTVTVQLCLATNQLRVGVGVGQNGSLLAGAPSLEVKKDEQQNIIKVSVNVESSNAPSSLFF
jgi:hypothetical protein